MQLSQLLDIPPSELAIDPEVNGLQLDSRRIQAGNVFCACQGTQVHGEVYIDSALQAGAVAVLTEQPAFAIDYLPPNIPRIAMPELTARLGHLAARFYQDPSANIEVIGVTGTNGKTSTSYFIAQCLQTLSPCGLFGTLGYGVYGDLKSATHTTPDAIRLQAMLTQLRAQRVGKLAMEVSSHALSQARVNGIRFNTAVFTNLSRDHLDYHGTMAAYGAAKQRLFDMPDLTTAVINQDDAFGQHLISHLTQTAVTVLTYSIQNPQADFYAKVLRSDLTGSLLHINTPVGEIEVLLPLYGQFNVSNALATLAVLLTHGIGLAAAQTLLATVPPVPGRMERCSAAGQPTVIIDYAHTPDALQQALQAMCGHCGGRLWCVFGCGGDRDKGKRPVMGALAEQWADVVVVTDDNPRHESSSAIIHAILAGCQNPAHVMVIPDRRQAIEQTLQGASAQDIVLIAGKGHETYQQIGDTQLPFSDRRVVQAVLGIEHG